MVATVPEPSRAKRVLALIDETLAECAHNEHREKLLSGWANNWNERFNYFQHRVALDLPVEETVWDYREILDGIASRLAAVRKVAA